MARETYRPGTIVKMPAIANARIGIPAVLPIGALALWIGFQLGGWFGILVALPIIRFVVTGL